MTEKPKINQAGIEAIFQQYKQICIAENAFENDTGGYNDNYEQRKIALRDVLDIFILDHFDEISGRAFGIDKEIKNQVWHLTLDDKGRNKYVQLK